MREQPRSRRLHREIDLGRAGHRRQIDKAPFERIGPPAGMVAALDREHGAAVDLEQAPILLVRGADLPAVEVEPIILALLCHFVADVGDFERGAVNARMRNEGAGTLAAFDQPRLDQSAQRPVHGHPRTAIGRHQLMFIGDAVAGLPFARHDPRLDIAADLRMESAALLHASSACIAAR